MGFSFLLHGYECLTNSHLLANEKSQANKRFLPLPSSEEQQPANSFSLGIQLDRTAPCRIPLARQIPLPVWRPVKHGPRRCFREDDVGTTQHSQLTFQTVFSPCSAACSSSLRIASGARPERSACCSRSKTALSSRAKHGTWVLNQQAICMSLPSFCVPALRVDTVSVTRLKFCLAPWNQPAENAVSETTFATQRMHTPKGANCVEALKCLSGRG
jgi:hypothetical protein